MASPNEKLADALSALKALQDGSQRIFRSKDLSRVHRERLLKTGFLREITKGWLMSASPQTQEGDTTPWYASFWEFCTRYCGERFGKDWYLSPEQSLLLHAEATAIPRQVIINSTKGTNNNLVLPFGTSLYDLKVKEPPQADDLSEKSGLRVYSPDAAIIKVPEAFFQRAPVEAQIVLSSIRDELGILGRLLDGGHSAVAGRIVGAFRRTGRTAFADDIISTMKGAGYDVREIDPFAKQHHVPVILPGVSPIVSRLKAIWEAQRGTVMEIFRQPPGLASDKAGYLKFVDEIYRSDAYHSLSIEGYNVTPELIDRVRLGSWNPEIDQTDRQIRDALAARGYWQAFQKVKESIVGILDGAPSGALARGEHRAWYRELFQPSVTAGILRPSALAGYRTSPVYLRGSSHITPRAELVAEGMNALFDLLEKELEPSVRAVLGHWLVGYLHPYPDGNGRMARFLMNVMLASGGYPWTIVRVEDRETYLSGLETASVQMDLGPFTTFLAERVQWSIEKAS